MKRKTKEFSIITNMTSFLWFGLIVAGCATDSFEDPAISNRETFDEYGEISSSQTDDSQLDEREGLREPTGNLISTEEQDTDDFDFEFEQAVCICEDLTDIGNGMMTQTLLSVVGITQSSNKGHVAVNGNVGSIGNLLIDGNFQVGGWLNNTGNLRVKGDLSVGSDLINSGLGNIEGDTTVGGDMLVSGFFNTKGAVGIEGTILPLGLLFYGSLDRAPDEAPTDPCPCDPQEIIDVATIVADHRTDPPLPIDSGIGATHIRLDSGDYYTDNGNFWTGISSIRIHGNVRLFIDGNVDMIGHRQIDLAPGAKLDLYVSGSVRTVGNFLMGMPEDVASNAIRLFIGGAETVTMDVICSPLMYIPGSVYAPSAVVRFINANIVVKGSLFVRRIMGFGSLTVVP